MSAKKPKPETHHPKPAPVPPDVALGTDGQYYHKIRDEHFTTIHERLTTAAFELAFADNHCENDSIPEAQEIITNTLGNLSGIQEELDALRVERDDQP